MYDSSWIWDVLDEDVRRENRTTPPRYDAWLSWEDRVESAGHGLQSLTEELSRIIRKTKYSPASYVTPKHGGEITLSKDDAEELMTLIGVTL